MFSNNTMIWLALEIMEDYAVTPQRRLKGIVNKYYVYEKHPMVLSSLGYMNHSVISLLSLQGCLNNTNLNV